MHGLSLPLVGLLLGGSGTVFESTSLELVGSQSGAEFGWSVTTAGDVDGDGASDLLVAAYQFDPGTGHDGRVWLYRGGDGLGLGDGDSVADWFGQTTSTGAAAYGFAVSTAGDVNGDGYDDVIIGAPLFSSTAGRAFIYMGSATGLELAPDVILQPSVGGGEFGTAVAGGGDVNGDGYDDVLVGAPEESSSDGRAYLYLGSASGLANSPAWSFEFGISGVNTGISVAILGDINADRIDDLAVGSLGRVAFFTGVDGGLPPSMPSELLSSTQPDSWFGRSVAPAGDFDGDGFADLMVGEPRWDEGPETDGGKVSLFRGSGTGLVTPAWYSTTALLESGLGWSVSVAGDIDGDSRADIVMGAPSPAGSTASMAHVLRGTASPVSIDQSFVGEASSSLGRSVASAGDFNGDGFGDIVIGEHGFDVLADDNMGRVVLYFGKGGELGDTEIWTFSPPGNATDAINSAAGRGDVNGDGFGDILIGSPNTDSARGLARVFLGSATGPSLAEDWSAQGDTSFEAFGLALDIVGDVNGDGYDDIVVGAPEADFQGDMANGKLYLYLGGPSGPGVMPAWSSTVDSRGGRLGQSVAAAGDVNGDGFADFLAGSLGWDGPGARVGAVLLFLGAADVSALEPAWIFESPVSGASLGGAVASAGDVNADGYSDIVLGHQGRSNGQSSEGFLYGFLGGFDGLAESPDWVVESDQAGANLGRKVAGGIDVDGDGYSDVIASAVGYDASLSDAGAIFLYRGSALGLESSASWSFFGEQVGEFFGLSLSGLGDTNGDGFDDFCAGSWIHDGPASNSGRALVFYGSPSGPRPGPIVLEGSALEDGRGRQLSHSDVNGDGFSDLVVGYAKQGVPSVTGGVAVQLGNRGASVLRLRQLTSDGSTRVGLLNTSDTNSVRIAIELQNGTAGWAAGRKQLHLEYQFGPSYLPLATLEVQEGLELLDAAPGMVISTSALVEDMERTQYRWRVRLASNDPRFPHGPWFTLPGNASTAGKVRPDCTENCPTMFCMGTSPAVCACDNIDPAAGCANSTGIGALLEGPSELCLSAARLDLVGSGFPRDHLALVFMSDTVTSDAIVGDGRVCIGGSTYRFLPFRTGLDGSLSLQDIVSRAPAGFFVPGESRYFQVWYRDVFCALPLPLPCPSPCGNGSNVSNGIGVFTLP